METDIKIDCEPAFESTLSPLKRSPKFPFKRILNFVVPMIMSTLNLAYINPKGILKFLLNGSGVPLKGVGAQTGVDRRP